MVPSLDSGRNGRKIKRYVHCSVVREVTEPRGGPGGTYKPRGSVRLEASHKSGVKAEHLGGSVVAQVRGDRERIGNE